MAMDPVKAAKAFQAYLDNAEKSSGKTIDEMQKALKASGISNHTEQRTFLMTTFGLGHGHAQAVLTKFKSPEFHGGGAAKTAPKKAGAKKPAAKK
jgi:hypothetical protein